jgi:hypothetical protein
LFSSPGGLGGSPACPAIAVVLVEVRSRGSFGSLRIAAAHLGFELDGCRVDYG